VTARTENSYQVLLDGAGGTLPLRPFEDEDAANLYLERLARDRAWRDEVTAFSSSSPQDQHAIRNGSRLRLEYQGHLVVERPIQFR
jgi:hypothetical protein